MSITISTDVFCNICGNWIEGSCGPRPQVRQARRAAKKAGWLRCHSPFDGCLIDACPGCVKEYSLPTTALRER